MAVKLADSEFEMLVEMAINERLARGTSSLMLNVVVMKHRRALSVYAKTDIRRRINAAFERGEITDPTDVREWTELSDALQ